MLTYSDPVTGQVRIKPRYVWAIGSFTLGFLMGAVLVAVM